MKLTEQAESNVLRREDSPVHDWYRFVLSYPPHLVRKYVDRFGLGPGSLLCDPFCGTGTTLVEAKKLGIESIGFEAHPFAAMVSRVKTNWGIDPASLRSLCRQIVRKAESAMSRHGLEALSFDAELCLREEARPLNGYGLNEEQTALLPTGFVSERPLGRLLILRHVIESICKNEPFDRLDFFFVALAHAIANGAGNFAFGPEIYRTKAKEDYDVLGHFARRADSMIEDLERLRTANPKPVKSRVIEADARMMAKVRQSVDAVITSPPYPNEKDYTRTTRVESLLLGFMHDRSDLREMKEQLLRSNTRNVFVADDDGKEAAEFSSIQKVCRQIEARRIELKKNSGFEKLYHKVVAHYFGGMRKHLRALKPLLSEGARLAYVVGDQLSFLMVPVATARLLAEVAEAEGYKVTGIDLWRERTGTKVRNSKTAEKTVRVREEVLLLENSR